MMENASLNGTLGIMWWNANNFFHFRPEEAKSREQSRWPQSREEYQEKCSRVDAALLEFFAIDGPPRILALGEITREAATQLRDRILPDYRVLSLDVMPSEPTSQVAALYAPDDALIQFSEQPPLVPPRTTRATRPMGVIDAKTNGHIIRFVICHWTARMDEDASKKLRYRTADFLSGECFDFTQLNPKKNHVAIIGDFNEDPFEDGLATLNAHRHRGRSQGKHHWADEDVKRVHLYNPSWRLLGEQYPHPKEGHGALPLMNCAGTYYWEEKNSWRNFDQLIVSGGLLGVDCPRLDEDNVKIISIPAFLSEGLPCQFFRKNGKFSGLSDHLPIYATLNI